MNKSAIKALIPLCGLAVLLWACPGLALDDGGGRSVFARGAGERALALGGAYCAVADDPGAMVWNPAGLARLQRKNLYAGHTNLIGMGFSEQLGLLAVPNWKLGTFGVGIRRFGVDGIEGRNDRGTIYDDNLKDAETEVLLGYGKHLGEAWNIGMAFKYQQQSLAGYSDGAPGLDLGVLCKPLVALGGQGKSADALSLGFAVRNLMEPNLRLDEEAVKDPTGLRVGMAYSRNLTGSMHLLLASDLEKTREMDTHVHLGTELTLMDLLSLRLGSNAGLMTAGAGFHLRNMLVDYTYEDNPLESVHRFGLGLAFGPTTEESRQRQLTAQEAELRKKLTAAFMQENDSRVQGLLGQARWALQDGKFDDVLYRTETIRVLDPDNPDLKELESAAYFGRGLDLENQEDLSGAAIDYQRCLALDPNHTEAANHLKAVSEKSDHLATRSAKIRQQFDTALEHYARGELVQARDGFTKVLDLKPDDKEAAALLSSTRQTLSLRAGSLIDQARAQAATGQFQVARQTLDQARSLAPGHPGLLAAAAFVDQQEQAQAAALQARRLASLQKENQTTGPVVPKPISKPKAVIKPTYGALSAKEKQEVADLYQKGVRALAGDRNEEAIRYWELVWAKAPDYQSVTENLKREYLAMGMEAFASGRLDQSIEIWEKAQRVDPGDKRTTGYLARAYEHKSRIREIKGNL